ncbi:nucleoporin NDC1-like isoform X2 [Hyalella azteca]|uniref:Nucleoporin NDC1-like isoform X1 n=1 Tax=Hyalella azteca TaxID=294128 RepID=A0A979FJ29_HYAAZ|nr:nucleoporin NDC1-like isoform X1 [Hyalella azteca]XP_047736993.1 nucleoporin NDC1-like isoform X2 [Hyalella azteca]
MGNNNGNMSMMGNNGNVSMMGDNGNMSIMGNNNGNMSMMGNNGNMSMMGDNFGNISLLGRNDSTVGYHMGNTSLLGGNFGNASMVGNTLGNTSMLGNTSTMGNNNATMHGNMSTTGNIPIIRNAAGNMALFGHAVANCDKVSTEAGTETKKKKLMEFFKSTLASAYSQLVEKMRRLPLVRSLLADLPDAANRRVFAGAMPLVWLVQGLCGLVTASYTEDEFGVVQRDLSNLLAAILNLNLVLDKVGRAPLPKLWGGGGGVGVVGGMGGSTPHHLTLRRALKSALRTAMYRLTHTFGDTLMEVELSSAHRAKVKAYLDLREG